MVVPSGNTANMIGWFLVSSDNFHIISKHALKCACYYCCFQSLNNLWEMHYSFFWTTNLLLVHVYIVYMYMLVFSVYASHHQCMPLIMLTILWIVFFSEIRLLYSVTNLFRLWVVRTTLSRNRGHLIIAKVFCLYVVTSFTRQIQSLFRF